MQLLCFVTLDANIFFPFLFQAGKECPVMSDTMEVVASILDATEGYYFFIPRLITILNIF